MCRPGLPHEVLSAASRACVFLSTPRVRIFRFFAGTAARLFYNASILRITDLPQQGAAPSLFARPFQERSPPCPRASLPPASASLARPALNRVNAMAAVSGPPATAPAA